jgi:iron complex outermembrane receptor protein
MSLPAGAACTRRLAAAAFLALAVAPLRGQRAPVRPDTARRDSTRIQPLPTVRVNVLTDRRQAVEQVPWAVGVVGTRELRRAQPTVTLDEALGSIPGVFVASRYNYATDSRISIRGAGARANFGVRGLKVFIDGVPQTLPDGQSQLTNVELGQLDRVEVLRGSTASLYGNGSAGVLAFGTDLSSPAPVSPSLRLLAGSFGLRKTQLRVGGRGGNAVGALSLSRTTFGGFRQYSAAETRQLNGALDIALSPATTLEIRAQAAEVPEAANPGALTFAEWRLNADSASAVNIRRGADRRVAQDQVSVSLRRGRDGDRATWVTTAWLSSRTVRNALSTPAPGPVTPINGIYATLNRSFGGVRTSGSWRLGESPSAPTLAAGVDVQRMNDRRINRRSTGGRPVAPTDTILLDQFERVTSVGPFVQATWAPTTRLLLSAGGRYDRISFSVTDDHFGDGGTNGGDNSGSRTLPAWSGHLGATFTGSEAFAPYANVSTSFETPTTTELQVRPDRQGGFNPDLGPQRALSVELGARGALATALSWNVAAYRARVSNAIVQSRFLEGTAFFENAGLVRNEGLEAGASVRLGALASVNAAYTWSRLRYLEYRQRNGAVVDTLDGRQVPGVPPHQLRLSLRTGPWRGASIDVDQTWTSALVADDANTLRVPGWGPGLLNARLAWTMRIGRQRIEPFAGILNALDTRYNGAVTVNGAGGRVLEPAPPRNYYLGVDLGGLFGR